MGCFSSVEARPEGDIDLITSTELSERRRNQHKLILIGNSSVGKSSLVNCFLDKPFSTEHRSTIGTSFATLLVCPKEGMEEITLQVWDTAGEERFRSMTKHFYRKAQVALLVFDVTSLDTLQSLVGWHEDILATCPQVKFIMIGNKTDLPQVVEKEEAEALARQLQAELFWTSSKNNVGVLSMLQHAALLTL